MPVWLIAVAVLVVAGYLVLWFAERGIDREGLKSLAALALILAVIAGLLVLVGGAGTDGDSATDEPECGPTNQAAC